MSKNYSTTDIKTLFLPFSKSIKKIEENISKSLNSDYPLLNDISSYLLNLGGKRIRPLLTLLSYSLFSKDKDVSLNSKLIDVASGIELIHMATLLHDDIIDKAETRRRKISAFRKYGLANTLLTGDFLLVKAFGICANLDKFIIEETEKACIQLTEGEAMEGVLDINNINSIDSYFEVAKKKTASLFSLSSRVGTFLAEGSAKNRIDNMKEFGYNSGIAFQIVDDILDITANQNLLGKESGKDLIQKTPSLVNLIWIEQDRKNALDFFSKEKIPKEEVSKTINKLKDSKVIDKCRETAKDYISYAKKSLDNAVINSYYNLDIKLKLEALLDYTLTRCM